MKLSAGAYYVDDRVDVVLIEGEDAQSYLHGQLSADVSALNVGEWSYSLLLEPSGSIAAWGVLIRTDVNSYGLVVEQGWGERAADRLRRFLLRTKATTTVASWERRRLRDLGTAIGAAESALAAEDRRGFDEAGLYAITPGWPGGAIDVYGPGPLEAVTDAEGTPVPPASAATILLARIAAGVPELGAEIDERTIPAAAGVVEASASFTKGCYVGQEQIARIDSRGSNTPERLRRFVSVDPSALPEVGSALSIDGDEVGRITSVAATLDGRFLALGYLHRRVEVPNTVRSAVGMVDAELVEPAL